MNVWGDERRGDECRTIENIWAGQKSKFFGVEWPSTSCFVEIWKATTYQRANHFTGSFLWKVSDWHFKVEVDSIESKSFQQSPKLLPRSRWPRHYKYLHFNFLSNSFLRNVLFFNMQSTSSWCWRIQTTWMPLACVNEQLLKVSWLKEVFRFCGLTSERVCDASCCRR